MAASIKFLTLGPEGAETELFEITEATPEKAGLMSAADKTRLNNVNFTDVSAVESEINVALGSAFTKTVTEAVTFSFTGVPEGKAAVFSLVLENGGTNVTWPESVKWSGGTAPELANEGTDVLTFFTADAGTTWYGVHSVQGAV